MIELYHGDCLEIMPSIPNKSIDMILCDLPYGTTQNKWDSMINLNLLWQHYERIVKPNGAILLFAQTPFDKTLGFSNIRMLRYEIIWVKNQSTGFMNAKKMPLKAHENILVFYKSLPHYNPIFSVGKPYTKKRNGKQETGSNYGKVGIREHTDIMNEGLRYPNTILKFDIVPFTERTHPTEKPIQLLEYLVKTYTNEGDTVLDNCMGSGTTGLACRNLNRNFIGIEKDEKYFEIAKKRVYEDIYTK